MKFTKEEKIFLDEVKTFNLKYLNKTETNAEQRHSFRAEKIRTFLDGWEKQNPTAIKDAVKLFHDFSRNPAILAGKIYAKCGYDQRGQRLLSEIKKEEEIEAKKQAELEAKTAAKLTKKQEILEMFNQLKTRVEAFENDGKS